MQDITGQRLLHGFETSTWEFIALASRRDYDAREFSENDGTLKVAQGIAGHAGSRTTKPYDRRAQKVLLEDMERIPYQLTQIPAGRNCNHLKRQLKD